MRLVPVELGTTNRTIRDFVNVDMMSGAWTEWRDDLKRLYWLRINLTRVSAQCGVIAGAHKADPNADPMAMKGKVPAKH